MLVEIYTRDGCTLCEEKKAQLRSQNVPFTEYVIDKDVTRDSVKAAFPRARMLPVIVVDGVWMKDDSRLQMLLG